MAPKIGFFIDLFPFTLLCKSPPSIMSKRIRLPRNVKRLQTVTSSQHSTPPHRSVLKPTTYHTTYTPRRPAGEWRQLAAFR